MIVTIEVYPGNLAQAICSVVMTWADVAEAGLLRITPNPVNPRTYLVLTGDRIVARLQLIDEPKMVGGAARAQ